MRPAVTLALALVSALSLGASAPAPHAPPRAKARQTPAPAAPLPVVPDGGGDPQAGILALRTPGPAATRIRAGSFRMGSTEPEIGHAITLCKLEPGGQVCTNEIAESFMNEASAHEVYLSDYWLDRTEVTVARYRRCVAAGACDEPPYASGGQRFDQPNFPVVLVSWFDAAQFCAWEGGRLPTEAEWERAAKGGTDAGATPWQLSRTSTGRRYPWGDIYNPFHANHGQLALPTNLDDGDGFLELAPVGSFLHGRTPDGLEDLAGNVEEWVADYYAPQYPAESARDPRGPSSGDERVVRGGSYVHGRPWIRAAARLHDLPSTRRTWRGFRCAHL
ncbi:formylglycine-generating enzyme family protein [Chondromyces apiculatus]|nr:SUMF1/EgtB/PvdO family nonheme iron enzyme [Chondromyces apiculatus]